ncbi:uncharacterized protein Dwil_GK13471 [Drosophila willistoni]|uniref:SWIM-type domain-containing protein n=1 Tax=Drosophila willistoni TaxID=7260 RepID=B4NJ42_DROWI|nr:uncharacterized protein Dwil_GK13471 [Drosophila willistoni]
MEADTEILELEIKKNVAYVLPQVLDQIFKQCEETKGDNPEKHLNLIKKLNCVLSDELITRALELLDKWNIVYYCTRYRIRGCYVAEWSSKNNNLATTYRIVPGTNYCKCQFFQSRVLQMDESKDSQEAIPFTSSQTFAPLGRNLVSYTCEHILAERIHSALIKPQKHILSQKQYLYLLESLYED